MKYAPLQHYSGNVGRDPEELDTKNGPRVIFQLAITRGFGKDADDTQWAKVWVSKEPLMGDVLEKVYKGARVVVVGPEVNETQYEGQTYYDITAFKVGLVDWLGFRESDRKARPAPRTRAQSTPVEDEDVDF